MKAVVYKETKMDERVRKIIFDTDLGGDCDDVTALDLLLSAHNAKECELIGITYSDKDFYGPSCIYAILKQYNHTEIPVGSLKFTRGENIARKYAGPVAKRFAGENAPNAETAEDAKEMLKRLIRENPGVVIVATGTLANLAAIVVDPEGFELIKNNVSELDVMACNFWHQNCIRPLSGFVEADGTVRAVGEWNVICDVKAAQTVFEKWPTKIMCSPFELGESIKSGGEMYARGKDGLADSYCLYVHGTNEDGRSSWDPCTALYAIYGAGPWFYKSTQGIIKIADNGVSHFATAEGGRHQILEARATNDEIASTINEKIRRLF